MSFYITKKYEANYWDYNHLEGPDLLIKPTSEKNHSNIVKDAKEFFQVLFRVEPSLSLTSGNVSEQCKRLLKNQREVSLGELKNMLTNVKGVNKYLHTNGSKFFGQVRFLDDDVKMIENFIKGKLAGNRIKIQCMLYEKCNELLKETKRESTVTELKNMLKTVKSFDIYTPKYRIDKLEKALDHKAATAIQRAFKIHQIKIVERKYLSDNEVSSLSLEATTIKLINQNMSNCFAEGIASLYLTLTSDSSNNTIIQVRKEFIDKFGSLEQPSDFIHPNSKTTALILFPTSDWNNAFKLYDVFQKNLLGLSELHTVRFRKISNPNEMALSIEEIGSQETIRFLLIGGHGAPTQIQLGTRHCLNKSEIEKIGKCFRRLYAADIGLLSCCTGKEQPNINNIAFDIASEMKKWNRQRISDINVYAPNEISSTAMLYIDKCSLKVNFIVSKKYNLHALLPVHEALSHAFEDRKDITTHYIM